MKTYKQFLAGQGLRLTEAENGMPGAGDDPKLQQAHQQVQQLRQLLEEANQLMTTMYWAIPRSPTSGLSKRCRDNTSVHSRHNFFLCLSK